jgi:LysM repeat protein
LLLILVLLLTGVTPLLAQDASGSPAAQGSTYTVKAGDVLDLIAAANDVQVDCLAKANDLKNPGKLTPGQVLIISTDCPRYDGLAFVPNPRADAGDLGQGGGGGAKDAPPGQGGGVEAPQAGPNDKTYTVQRGDVLDTIGQQFNVSVQSLQLANNLTPRSVLMPGVTLIIPADAVPYGQFPSIPAGTDLGQGGGGGNQGAPPGQGGGVEAPQAGPNDKTYIVQPLDTLDKIGANFDTQVECIAKGNNLASPSRIFPGQTMIIPASCPKYDGFDVVTNPRSS